MFRFQKDIQSEKGWRFDILCMRSANALLCYALIGSVARARGLLLRHDIVLNLFLFLFQYIRTCVSKGVRPVLSLVLRSSLQVEVLDMSGRSHVPQASFPPLPQKSFPATLSLWDIETHVRIKIVSAANVNAGDIMKVCQVFLYFYSRSIKMQ